MIKPYFSLFQEKILGNKAIVYHRTNVKNLIKKVYTSGFRPGNGNFYGKGFYSTFDLESQLEFSMQNMYGNVIVKFIITSLYNFFIYEWDEFIKTSVYDRIKDHFRDEKITKKNFIVKQYEFYFDRKRFSKNIIKNLEEYNKKLSLKKIYSSEIALYLYKILNNINAYKSNIDGIIFKGRTDGKVLVCYDVNLLKPIEYTNNEGVTWKKVNDINKEIIDQYNKKVLDSTSSSFYKNIKNFTIPKDFWFLDVIKNHKIPKENYEIIHEEYYLDSPFRVIWKKGTWNYPEAWEYGTWLNGSWENGTWNFGTWKDGVWKEGFWNFGTWKDGIWYDGTWRAGGWEKGTWRNGVWKDGHWENGNWMNGTWMNGTWEIGTWHDGTWKNGKWKNGIWKNGVWKKGNWLNGIWQDGTWRGGTWHDGIWRDGVWMNGTWKDGKWKSGVWKKGVWEKGWILDPEKKGNYEIDWEWKDGYVLSPVSPKEYFGK